MLRITILGAIILFLGCVPEQPDSVLLTDADKKEIKGLARDLPLILTNEGWEAYESKFSSGYQNWSMMGDKVRSREDYLKLVKDWYDAGNRANASEVETIDFIPVATNKVLYLYSQKETFNDPNDSTQIRVRDIRMVSTFVKESEGWKYDFTAFMDKP